MSDKKTPQKNIADAFAMGQNQPQQITVAKPPFKPTYITNPTCFTDSGPYPLSNRFWATFETAHEIADRFIGEVVSLPPYWTPGKLLGPATMWNRESFYPANMYFIKFSKNTFCNAGDMASYYTRNPEDQFPGLADKYIVGYIQSAVKEQEG